MPASSTHPIGSPRVTRWRRLLAALAGTTLALSGVGALGLAPAAADEAEAPVACVEPQVLAEDGITCVDPPAPAEEQPAAPECVEPQVLSDDGTACVDPAPAAQDPVAEEPVEQPAPEPAPAEAAKSEAAAAVVAAAPQGKIAFCHRTASNSNPYVPLETNLNAFYNAGHIGHTGPVWPATGPDGKWGDIYPPNIYDADGQNWGPGAEDFVANGCSSTPTNNPGISLDVEGCVYYDGSGYAEIVVTATLDDFYYVLYLGDDVVDEGWGDEDISYWDYLEPGSYDVTVQMWTSDVEGKLVSTVATDFVITDCPELGIAVDQITCSADEDATAMLHLTGLIEGEEYDWSVEGPGDAEHSDGSFIADGPTRDLPLSGLAPGAYTATVIWLPSISEATAADAIVLPEPEWWVEASVEFTVVACPPLPTLAATGVDGRLVNVALLLLVLGGGALAIAQTRRNSTGYPTVE